MLRLWSSNCQRLPGTALLRLSERGFGFRVSMTTFTSLDGRPRAAIQGRVA